MRINDPTLPLVTVIIPCYNHAQYLPTSIECALNQDYPNIEVIVVNDGSSDDTSQVAEKYKEQGVVLINQVNAGLSASRNAGIMLSRGDIMCFLDADDRMDLNLISERVKLFDSDRVGIVAGAYRFTDPDLEPYAEADQLAPPDYVVNAQTTVWAALSPNCGLLVRKRAFVECGFYDPLLRACEDWDQQNRICQKFEHRFDPVRRSDYRQLPRSMSRDPVVMFDNGMTVIRKAQVYVGKSFKTRLNCSIGLFRHTVSTAILPILNEQKGFAGYKSLFRFILSRPSAAVFLLAGIMRKVYNNIFRRRLLKRSRQS
ncbi:MAG: glycosyltransferase family 2 protein [Fimbriimonadaceae bacterium]|nr:glycosyltransferase family 2 protein [Fimbriimonadaceae bacterium]